MKKAFILCGLTGWYALFKTADLMIEHNVTSCFCVRTPRRQIPERPHCLKGNTA